MKINNKIYIIILLFSTILISSCNLFSKDNNPTASSNPSGETQNLETTNVNYQTTNTAIDTTSTTDTTLNDTTNIKYNTVNVTGILGKWEGTFTELTGAANNQIKSGTTKMYFEEEYIPNTQWKQLLTDFKLYDSTSYLISTAEVYYIIVTNDVLKSDGTKVTYRDANLAAIRKIDAKIVGNIMTGTIEEYYYTKAPPLLI